MRGKHNKGYPIVAAMNIINTGPVRVLDPMPDPVLQLNGVQTGTAVLSTVALFTYSDCPPQAEGLSSRC